MNRITFSPARPHTKRRRPQTRRLELELLEARNLLSGTPSNVLVNDPAQDTSGNLFGQTGLDTQSETAIVLGAKSNVIVAYNDTGTLQYPTPFNPAAIGIGSAPVTYCALASERGASPDAATTAATGQDPERLFQDGSGPRQVDGADKRKPDDPLAAAPNSTFRGQTADDAQTAKPDEQPTLPTPKAQDKANETR